MQLSISGPVGRDALNRSVDVLTVQRLLNQHVSRLGGLGAVQMDGRAGPRTLAAIEAFQKNVLGFSDGRVDPGGRTLHALQRPSGAPAAAAASVTPVAPVATATPSVKRGTVSGDIVGVVPELINFLDAVAHHYNAEVYVTSGKRDMQQQAEAMWKGWNGHLRKDNINGGVYTYLRQNAEIRGQLDQFFQVGKAATSTAAQKDAAHRAFVDQIGQCGSSLSRHLTGEAVDVRLSTSPKVLAALKLSLHYLAEYSAGQLKCHHFDTAGKKITLTPAHIAAWPAP